MNDEYNKTSFYLDDTNYIVALFYGIGFAVGIISVVISALVGGFKK